MAAWTYVCKRTFQGHNNKIIIIQIYFQTEETNVSSIVLIFIYKTEKKCARDRYGDARLQILPKVGSIKGGTYRAS